MKLPRHLFNGRVRTSTFALIAAFVVLFWLHQTYEPPPHPPAQAPASEVVPPGFVPDPNYTWVPRTNVQEPTTTSPTTTTTSPSETTTTSPTDSTSPGSPTPSATTTPPAAPLAPSPTPSPSPSR